MAETFYIPTSNEWFQFLHFLADTCYPVFFILGILLCVTWYLAVASIIEYHFICLLDNCITSL